MFRKLIVIEVLFLLIVSVSIVSAQDKGDNATSIEQLNVRILELQRQLKEMHETGLITEEEYTAKKKEILSRM